jgi:hypothetical protein
MYRNKRKRNQMKLKFEDFKTPFLMQPKLTTDGYYYRS